MNHHQQALGKFHLGQMETDISEDILRNLAPALKVLSGGNPQLLGLTHSTPKTGSQVVECYAAVPRLSNPRVLLPLDAKRRAWPTMLRQYSAGAASPWARSAVHVLAFANRLGLTNVLLRDRIQVVTHQNNLCRSPLRDFLSGMLGRDDFVTSLRVAPRRPNGKPVVQAVAHDGTALAYAKFGWEKLTRKLIRHEATVLAELGPLTCGTRLRVPKLLYNGDWHGLEAMVVAPLSGVGHTPRLLADLPIAAAAVLRDLRPETTERLGDSAFWQRTSSQAAEAAGMLSERGRSVIQRACEVIEQRWGDVRLQMGQSHGDWIPPNISVLPDGRVNVWDWERSESDVPLGVDTMQFVLFLKMQRQLPSNAVSRRVLVHGQKAITALGLQPQNAILLMTLSLLRSLLWFGEARQAGREEDEDMRFVKALEECLELKPEA